MSDLRFKVGLRVSQLRKTRGWTQDQLAEKCGLSSDTIGNIERGQRAPSFSALERLAKVLDVEERELFNFEEAIFQLKPDERRSSILKLVRLLSDVPKEKIEKLIKIARLII